MAINFHPKRGTVLMCDFTTGFRVPEMVKRRPVVVISPRYRRHTGLCIVVPFSTVPPHEIELHHHEIPSGKYPFFDPAKPIWAKADMLTCVCFERLDRLLVFGRYNAPSLTADDFDCIQRAVASALQLDVSGTFGV
jgi:uncharacterized protein YifN (PemK superfamily)